MVLYKFRELTQLQSILQNQLRDLVIMYSEGTLVIPGGLSVNKAYDSIKLSSAFTGETIDVSQYYNATKDITIVENLHLVLSKLLGLKKQLQQLILYYMFNTFRW